MNRGRLGILATAALVLVGLPVTARSQIIETPKGVWNSSVCETGMSRPLSKDCITNPASSSTHTCYMI